MAQPSETDLKRRLRAMAAWAEEEQPALAAAIGVNPSTFKGYFSTKPGPPVDVVLRLADYLAIPSDFVLHGWSAVKHDAELERRLAAIERHVGIGTG
ncbi:MAG: helix-turn-helix transcriptional regulator [Patulibacter minatonensis]